MSQRRQLTITVSPTGEVSVKVEGIPGQSCTGATKFLEDALGGEVTSREHTEEFYQAVEESDRIKQEG